MATEMALSGVAPVPSTDADVAAADYLQTRGWLYADRFTVGRSSTPETFRDEADLWRAALSGQGLYETRHLTLEDVVLTDWLPRSPGRYHTSQAEAAREEAQRRVAERHSDHVVYDASGKTSMVAGGVGCLRLVMKDIGGQHVKFLGATSSGIVHRGFVVAMDRDRYTSIADTVDKHGGVRCTIAGTVRSWNADENLDLVMAAGVPRVYLGVDELTRGTLSPTDLPPLDVTPAVTFEAGGEEYFTYTHFNPDDPGQVTRAVEWMDRYVSERYGGRVMTDFDELVTRFADTAAPLRTLMDPEVPFEQIAAALALHMSGSAVTVITNNFREVVMGDKYEISRSQVGAIGRDAHAEGITFVHNEIDVQALAEELDRLRLALKERGTEPEHDQAAGEVAAAQIAAKDGDTDGALRHLKQAGQWALTVATEIGVPVATSALKSALG
jgi:hypothetical protein